MWEKPHAFDFTCEDHMQAALRRRRKWISSLCTMSASDCAAILRFWADGRLTFPYWIMEGLPVTREQIAKVSRITLRKAA